MIIGLSGYARAGKDTVADILVEHHGFTKIAFADKLREALYELNPIVRWDTNEFGSWRYYQVQHVIDEYGWDGYKETKYGDEIRRLLQRVGTEAGRQTLGENVWVDAAVNEIAKYPVGTNIVIPDTRFPNEASMIKNRYNGYVWRVRRPDTLAANAHQSETALDNWDFDMRISNNGTIEQLQNVVKGLLEKAGKARGIVFAKPIEVWPSEEDFK